MEGAGVAGVAPANGGGVEIRAGFVDGADGLPLVSEYADG